MIDVETRDRKSLRATHDSLRVLLRLVEKHYGVRPMIYSGYSDVCGDAFPDYNFYIGRYGKKPPVRKGGYYIWQFTEKGKIDGFRGTVDLWRFHPDADVNEMLMPGAQPAAGRRKQ